MSVRESLAAEHPDVVAYSIDLAGSQCNFGSYLYESGRLEELISWYERSETILKKLMETNPRLPLAKKSARNVYAGRLRVSSGLKLHAEAIEFADKAIALDDGTQRLIYQQMKLKCQAHIQPESAVAAGEQLLQRHSKDPAVIFQVACVFAIATGESTSTQQQERYATRAIELLNQCQSRGSFSTPQGKKRLVESIELDSLRNRPEFQQILKTPGDRSPIPDRGSIEPLPSAQNSAP